MFRERVYAGINRARAPGKRLATARDPPSRSADGAARCRAVERVQVNRRSSAVPRGIEPLLQRPRLSPPICRPRLACPTHATKAKSKILQAEPGKVEP